MVSSTNAAIAAPPSFSRGATTEISVSTGIAVKLAFRVWVDQNRGQVVSPEQRRTRMTQKNAEYAEAASFGTPRPRNQRSSASSASALLCRDQLCFDIVRRVDLRPEHREKSRNLRRFSKEDGPGIILLTAGHDALDLPQRIDVASFADDGKESRCIANHVRKARRIALEQAPAVEGYSTRFP